MRKKVVSTLLVVTLSLTGLLSGCGSTSQSDAETSSDAVSSDASSDAASGDATVVTVGVNGAWYPMAYYDDDENLTGFEVALLEAVDEYLPEYSFEYQTYDFPELLEALSTDKVQLGAHQFSYSDERAESYLYGEEPITSFGEYVVVDGDNDEINSIEDLAGKTVYADTDGGYATWLEEYNEENPDKAIELYYGEHDQTIINSLLENGTIDAYIAYAYLVPINNEEYGVNHKTVGDPIREAEYSYYLYNQDETDLQEAVDGALKALRENGTIRELSIEWLGDDYS